MRKHSVTFLLLGVFLLSLASPLASPSQTSGRSTPNLSVQLISLDNGGSMNDGSNNLVQDSVSHSVVVIVKNKGALAGSGTLRLLHKGSPSADPVDKGTIPISNLAAGASTSALTFTWSGSLGDGQTLTARIESSVDSDLTDNEQSLYFNVVDFTDASFSELLTNPLPSIGSGETTARISKSPTDFEVSITNQGVDDFTAELEVQLTPVTPGPTPVSFTSNQEIMAPSSLYDVTTSIPQVNEILTASFDFTGASYIGDWDLTIELNLDDGSTTTTITVLEIVVTFSNYATIITPAQDRTTEPGMTTTLTYLLKNIGDVQGFSVVVDDVLGWVEPSPPNAVSPFSDSSTIDISVTVPPTAERSEVESVTVTFTSDEDPSYVISITTKVMAGESYGVLVTMPDPVTLLSPGKPTSVDVTITNTGNTPTTFYLSAGLTAPAVNWEIELTSSETSTVASGGDVTTSVELTPPPIKNPINPNEYNRAGDVLSVWVMASASKGGVPHQDSAPLEIRPVLTVDPGVETTDVYLTPSQVLAAKQGQGVDIILDLELEARHNLITNLEGTLDTLLSLGDVTFDSASTGGADEEDRWAIPEPSPSNFIDMTLDETYFASIGIQGPVDDYPVSGVMEIPLTTTPTLGAGFPAGIEAEEIDTIVRIHIPPVDEVDILQDAPFEVNVGEANSFDVELANLGNNQTSYRLTLVDELPLDWTGSFANSAVSQITELSSVRAAVADYPTITTNHISTFPITVTPASDAPANSIEHVTIVVENLDTGAYISSHIVEFIVVESIDLDVDPSSQLVNLSVGESVVTRVKISNTGNTQTLYNLWIDDSTSDEVEFEIETDDSVLVGSGFDTTVKIRLTASNNARADVQYKGTLWVESPASGLNVSADIIANISENHGVDIDPDVMQIAVIPGTQESIAFNISNLGNLAESVNLVINHSDGWGIDGDDQDIPLSIGETYAGSFILSVPSYDGSDSMLDGASHTITLTAYGDEDFMLDQEVIDVIIAPKFIPEFVNWPSEVEFNARDTRTWSTVIVNKGNKDVTVSLDYSIFGAGLSTLSTQFQLGADAPETLFLPKDVPVDLTFSIISTELEPDLTDAAELVLTVIPEDAGVTGSGEQITTLSMSRFFERQDEIFTPVDNSNIELPIRYSHIPTGVGISATYEVELCRSSRLIDLDELNLNESFYEWEFTLDIDGDLYPLNLTAQCGPSTSLGEESRYELPTISPYQTDSFTIIINPPNRPNLLSGDGWDLEFRLYHPDENAGYTVFDSDIFTFKLDSSADPGYSSIRIDNDLGAMEGEEVVVTAKLVNFGTAQAIGVVPTLSCDYADVLTQAEMIPILNDTDVVEIEWIIVPHTMDWFETVAPLDCEASLTSTRMEGNMLTNDKVRLDDVDRISAAPSITIAFAAFTGLLFLAFVFSRLKGQSEQWGHFSTYAAVLALGFAFYLMNVEYYGYGILAITALFLWRAAWKSGEEFRLVHEDYQRARKGNATVYNDHLQALKDGRRQLLVILSLPVFGLYAVILGVPPQLPTDNTNLGFFGAYFVFVSFGVWYLLRRSDRIYGNLYGRLTDVEIKAVRLDRDLRDPARLLNELADDGIDFEKFFDSPTQAIPATQSTSQGQNGGSVNEEESHDDGSSDEEFMNSEDDGGEING